MIFDKDNGITLLECTLRDGSYAIDYQFNAEDTAIICAGLESAGFSLIEIGHGLGLNASSKEHGFAAASDEAYLEAASGVLKKTHFGFFCIPGIARLSDIDLAAKYRTGFIRVGTNVTEVEQAEPFIKRAKDHGMMVFSNLMKSYAIPIDDFMEKVKLSLKYGADVIAVVDSAGGMLPDDVRAYVARIRQEFGVTVDFHGHNNLHMAEANSLEAVKAGATIVDSSLQGMGRSAGNAQTELLIILLGKIGYQTGIDLYKAMDLGEKIVKPMMGGEKGVDPINAMIGAAQFHSSYLKIVERIAKKYQVDLRDLIAKVSNIDRVKVTEELAEKVAKNLPNRGENSSLAWNINLDFFELIGEYKELSDKARAIAAKMVSIGKKTGKKTIFTIAVSANKNKKNVTFPFIRQNVISVIGNAEVVNESQAEEIAKAIDGLVNIILVDLGQPDLPERIAKVVKQSQVLPYNDANSQINALDLLIAQLIPALGGKMVVICGQGLKVEKLAGKLQERGAIVSFTHDLKNNDQIDLLIGLTPYECIVSATMVRQLKDTGVLIDAGPASLEENAIILAQQRGLEVYRIDMRAGLSGEIFTILETIELKNKVIGKGEIVGIPVVAGGVLGKIGDIVLDSIIMPNQVIGVADGKGQLLGEEEIQNHQNKIITIKMEIAKRRFL